MAPALTANPYWAEDVAAAARYGLSPELLSAQQYIESGWSPSAVSPTGAFGISQFEPGTAASWGVQPGTTPAAVNSQINGEAALMASLLKQEGSLTGALEAYNAGPGGVAYAASNGAAGYASEILALAGPAGSRTSGSAPAGGGTFVTSGGNGNSGASSGPTPTASTTGIVGDIIGAAGGVVGSVIAGGSSTAKLVPRVESFLLSLVFVVAALGLILLGVTRLFPGATKFASLAAL